MRFSGMRSMLLWSGLAFLSLVFGSRQAGAQVTPEKSCSDYVNPFIGTQGEGNTYPAAVAPFGMIQIGPDTDIERWETASGYEYSDSLLYGFSLTHFSGTGIPDFGDFLFVPSTGKIKTFGGKRDAWNAGSYRTRFSHSQESAAPGYYSVRLPEYDINAEMTASDRAGFLRFTFPQTDSANIMIDLKHVLQWKVVWSQVRVMDDSTITGYHYVKGWARDRKVYFAARFSKKIERFGIYRNGRVVEYDPFKTYRFVSSNEAADTNLQFFAAYKTAAGEAITVKVAVSGVSSDNALLNMNTEIPHWDFSRVKEETRDKWSRELKRIEVEGTDDEKTTFYSSMYHLFLTPFLYQDADGSYLGMDKNIHKAQGFTNYTVFSLWDTYRAVHPLFMLIQNERNADMINSMLKHYEQSADHLLPVWSFYGNETWCMIGYHAVPVIADAVVKGLKGIDAAKCYDAVKATAMNREYDNVMLYAKLGYLPFDVENESVSKTLEYGYDDYCVAQMARYLGKTDDYNYFITRSKAYRNLYDQQTGYMRGKDSKGNRRTPFSPDDYSDDLRERDFTEGTSRQYSWYVPHEVQGLAGLMGREKFEARLDTLFALNVPENNQTAEDATGRIGEYWHGNEPSHHIIFLYDYIGKPWKAQKLVHKVVSTQYGSKPNSLCGNDDCGQMSAWYIFNALGFYPVCPSGSYYAVGSPCLPKAVVNLSGGGKLTIRSNNLSKDNIYIRSMTLNGKEWNKTYIPYEEIRNGGEIVFNMTNKPNRKWGTAPGSLPPAE